jgi:predicted DsbA family dithiol-disulfide isomerase
VGRSFPWLASARAWSNLPAMKKLDVQIWSDIACPWCYVGKRRLEAALAQFAHKDDVSITWRAFELDPSAPRVRDTSHSYAERLAEKYGRSVDQAQGMIDTMTQTGAGDGLELRFDRVQSGNTFDAHRVIHMATERGLGDVAKERLLRAYMTDGEPIGEPEVLVRLAADIGLDPAEVRTMLESGGYSREVRADESEARDLGIRGVPFFVFDGRYGVSGAQPADALLGVLRRVWDELPDTPAADGAVCGPDGCAV